MNNDSPKQKINASMDTDPWLKNPDGTMYAAPGTCEFVIYPTGYTAQELQANGEQAIRTFLGTDGKHLATVWKGQAVAVRDDYEKAGQTTYLFRQEWIVTYGEVVGP